MRFLPEGFLRVPLNAVILLRRNHMFFSTANVFFFCLQNKRIVNFCVLETSKQQRSHCEMKKKIINDANDAKFKSIRLNHKFSKIYFS